MSTRGLILAIVGTACVGAAAAGGYAALQVTPVAPVATKQVAEPPPATRVRTSEVAVQPSRPAPVARAKASPQPVEKAPAPVTSPTPTPDVAAKPDPTPVPATSTVEPPPPVQELEAPKFEELTIKQDAVIGIRLDAAVSSATARVEDKVTATVTRDVMVDGRTAIPSGARLEGNVMQVDRGGKFKTAARVVVKFHTLLLVDGLRLPMSTDAITRLGESPAGEATAKIGAGATLGALLGAVIGGRKGAVIGSAAGAAGGTAAVAAGRANEAVIPAGAPLTLRLLSPLSVTVPKQS